MNLWTANGKSVAEKLKQRSISPKQVVYMMEETFILFNCGI